MGVFGLKAEASNAWLVKPQTSFWYNLNDRWAAVVSASYTFGPSTIRFVSAGTTVYEQKVDAAAFRVSAGFGYKLF
jgi:hypothetical protein